MNKHTEEFIKQKFRDAYWLEVLNRDLKSGEFYRNFGGLIAILVIVGAVSFIFVGIFG